MSSPLPAYHRQIGQPAQKLRRLAQADDRLVGTHNYDGLFISMHAVLPVSSAKTRFPESQAEQIADRRVLCLAYLAG